MKINIGCGFKKLKGYINCDIDPEVYPDKVFNLEKDVYPFEDNSIDYVHAHHILEHLGEGYFHCIRELYRICKDGAIIEIEVPYHLHDDFFDDPTHKRPITLNGLMMFSKQYNYECRLKNNPISHLAYQNKVDFEIIAKKYIVEEKFKSPLALLSNEEALDNIHTHCNKINRLEVLWKVIK